MTPSCIDIKGTCNIPWKQNFLYSRQDIWRKIIGERWRNQKNEYKLWSRWKIWKMNMCDMKLLCWFIKCQRPYPWTKFVDIISKLKNCIFTVHRKNKILIFERNCLSFYLKQLIFHYLCNFRIIYLLKLENLNLKII